MLEEQFREYPILSPESGGLEFEDESKLMWILETPFQKTALSRKPYLKTEDTIKCLLVEIGPRLNFSTPFSTNAVSMCKSAGLKMVTRVEYSTRYFLQFESTFDLNADSESAIVNTLHDRMTECRYSSPVDGFNLEHKTEDIYEVDVIKEGREALEKANIEMGFTCLDAVEHGFRTVLIEDACRGVDLTDIDEMRKNLKTNGAVISHSCKIKDLVEAHDRPPQLGLQTAKNVALARTLVAEGKVT
ncbi:PFAS [Mytilus edulis]|uniref:PFAS n=1 Tax=Mytilus edulis TaxID=6550 RepID=A0A8S3SMT8_MYTED|nr:PFAS [Mytilus edulis]